MAEYLRSGHRSLIETPDGQVVFCPGGMLTRPYLLPETNHLNSIRAFMRTFTTSSIVLISVLTATVGWRIAALSAGILIVVYEVRVRTFLGLMTPKPKRLTFQQGFRIQAKAAGLAELEGIILLCLPFGAIAGFFALNTRENRVLCLAGLGCIVLIVALQGQMLRTKILLERKGIDPMTNLPANPPLNPTVAKNAPAG